MDPLAGVVDNPRPAAASRRGPGRDAAPAAPSANGARGRRGVGLWTRTLAVRRFAVVGVLNTAVDYVVFIALTKILHLPLDLVWIAKVISGTLAISLSFYLNRTWVFRAQGGRLGQAMRFLAATAVGVYGIQTLLTHVFAAWYPAVGLEAYDVLVASGITAIAPAVLTEALAVKTAAFVLATCASMTFNFLAYRYWVFRPRTDA